MTQHPPGSLTVDTSPLETEPYEGWYCIFSGNDNAGTARDVAIARTEEDANLIAAAPAMLAALERADDLLGQLRAGDLDDPRDIETLEMIESAIDMANGATPTAQPGVWRIISTLHAQRFSYWSNANGWGTLAASDGFTQAERETVNLPMGGRWWFDGYPGEF